MNKGRMEQLGQLQWKYSDPTRCIRSNVVSATCHWFGMFFFKTPTKTSS